VSTVAGVLARRLSLPRVELLGEVGSTLDVAHDLAASGAPAGTLIIADTQTAGRGRMGRSWRSEPGAGVWMTVIERPSDALALETLSLRVGLGIAPALEPLSTSAIRLKWPNDLYVGDRKLAGILIEARWREGHPDWVAIGVGINLRPPPDERRAIGLREGVSLDQVLEAAVPGIREAARRVGSLTGAELAAFAARDFAAGRACIQPVAGVVQGIDPTGGLLIDVSSREPQQLVVVRAGSLVLAEAQ
jgi:BirA family transcriptional regulator, biotin operon repressor / biotin---[acetyl-CoA-carboxylase] ligase